METGGTGGQAMSFQGQPDWELWEARKAARHSRAARIATLVVGGPFAAALAACAVAVAVGVWWPTTEPPSERLQPVIAGRFEDATNAAWRPRPQLTPGAVFKGVGIDELKKSGYCSSVRDVPLSLKKEVFRCYGHDPDKEDMGDYEFDHLISLELGGSNDIANIWPQPYAGAWSARHKDRLENKLHRLVCGGELSLRDAQHAIAEDWVAAYHKYVEEQ